MSDELQKPRPAPQASLGEQDSPGKPGSGKNAPLTESENPLLPITSGDHPPENSPPAEDSPEGWPSTAPSSRVTFGYSLGGLLIMLGVIGGVFGLQKGLSLPKLERWFVFSGGACFVAGWWLIMVTAADRRHAAIRGNCSDGSCSTSGSCGDRPLSPRELEERERVALNMADVARKLSCNEDAVHFVADSIFFAPNYFEETQPAFDAKAPLTSEHLMLAIVRYAQDYFGDDAEHQLASWGLDTRDRLQLLIEELVRRRLANLGTAGYEIVLPATDGFAQSRVAAPRPDEI